MPAMAKSAFAALLASEQSSSPDFPHLLASIVLVDSLYPLTERENVCKALLPVGNEPMISYTLNWLEQAGIVGAFTPSLMSLLAARVVPTIVRGAGAAGVSSAIFHVKRGTVRN